jgi:hypothetical protein
MVAAPMRTRFDQFGKQMVRAALEAGGTVETDAEVSVNTRRIDLWFMPDPARESVSDHLGVLARIASGPSTLEFFHNTPSGEELAACLIKHGEFRHFLSLRRTPPPVPTQWVISSGRPARHPARAPARRRLGAQAGDRRTQGAAGGSAGARAGAAHSATLAVDRAERSSEADDRRPEFLMATQDIVETWRLEAIQEGVKQGVAHSLLEVYEARFGAMPEDLRAVVEGIDDEPTLVRWLRLVGTRSADEIAAAIRSFRAS